MIKWVAALAFIGGGACAQTIQGPLQAQNSLGELAANGTQATARVNISAAASGANSDITSLTGLTTPLGGAYGGTGINNGLNTITLGSSLVTNGLGPLEFTTTGTTNVTVPTTGTLFSSSSTIPYTNLPALSANQLLGSLTATTPSGLSVPACTGANAALQWGAGSGFSCVTISAGTNAPGGANTDVQYNNSTAFGGNSSFTYNGSGSIGLGTSGSTTGNIAFSNGTSGVVNLTVPTGALGTVTDYLPLGGTLLTLGTANNTYATLGANTNITSLGGLTTPLSPSQGGSGVNNGTATETRAGNVTFSGAYPVTLTATASTGVTLPTTGTLLNNVASSANTVVGAASSTTRTDLSVPSCSGTSNALQWTSGTGFGCGSITGTAATPGGSTGQVQYNNAGAFAAAPGFTFDGSSAIGLGVAGSTVGKAVFSNATSGSITLQAPTGALGSVTDTLPLGGAIATTALVQSQQNGGCLNILNYGGSGNGVSDNTSAFNSAVAALPSGGGCLYFPAGKYDFASTISVTYPSSGIYSLALVGAGSDASILYWPSPPAGLTVNLKQPTQSIHVKNMTFSAGFAGGSSTALTINQAVPEYNYAQNDIYGVTFRGDDGGQLTDYWATGVSSVGASDLNFDNDQFFGNSANTGGTGIAVSGNTSVSPYYGLVINVSKSEFTSLGIGFSYGTYVQGVSISQSNFTDGAVCLEAPAGGTGLSQLALTADQFNCTNNDILLNSPISALIMQGNLLYIAASDSGLLFGASSNENTITGNVFTGISASGNAGISSTTTTVYGTDVTGNVFYNLADGLNIPDSNGWTIQNNSYSTVTTPVVSPTSSLTETAYATTPTIASGFGTSPSIAASNGTAVFTITVGSSPGSTGTVTMPTSPHGWACHATDLTTTSPTVSNTKETATTATSVTFTQYTNVQVTAPWVAGDTIQATCSGY